MPVHELHSDDLTIGLQSSSINFSECPTANELPKYKMSVTDVRKIDGLNCRIVWHTTSVIDRSQLAFDDVLHRFDAPANSPLVDS